MSARQKFLVGCCATLLAFFFSPLKVFAQVVINEFQVKPDQWIELYNKGGDAVDISGWVIDDNGGTEKYVISSGVALSAKKCMSFQSEKFNWNTTSSDTVRLLDSSLGLKEEYAYESAPTDNVSIGKLADGEGVFVVLSSSSRDKFNATGESCLASVVIPTLTSIPPTPTPVPTNASAISDYENISISEYLPYPESNNNEWAELYNDNDFEVNLNGWWIDDVDGGSSPKSISGTISAHNYKQFFLSSAFLNNDGDDVRLLNGSQEEKDSTSFEVSTKGKSWAMDINGNWCEVDPTPGSSNPGCPAPTSAATSSPTPAFTPTPTPTKKITPTQTPTPKTTPTTATASGEILGQESSPAAFFPWEATEGAEPVLGEKSSAPNRLLPAILLGTGFILLFSAAFWLWYTQLRK